MFPKTGEVESVEEAAAAVGLTMKEAAAVHGGIPGILPATDTFASAIGVTLNKKGVIVRTRRDHRQLEEQEKIVPVAAFESYLGRVIDPQTPRVKTTT